MGHFSMEIDAPTGSNLSGNQQSVKETIEILSLAIAPNRDNKAIMRQTD